MREFTVFCLDEMNFALDVGNVREVLRAAALSAVPGNSNLEGLLNLRGAIVPVVNLRQLLGLLPSAICASDFLVVVESDSRIAALRIEQPARLEQVDDADAGITVATDSECDFIAGTVRLGERFVSLLSASAILAAAGSMAGIERQGEATGRSSPSEA